MEALEPTTPAPRWWRGVLAVGLGLWLAGLWVWGDIVLHRLSLLALVLPGLILNRRELERVLRENRWWILAVVLVAYQGVSRLWSDPATAAGGYWLDALLVFVLLGGLLALARSDWLLRGVVPALALLAALAALVSLLLFYADPERSIADDRLRNVLVYEHGLNAVLTGLLCGFGGLVAAWKTSQENEGRWRWVWLAALVVLVLGVLATQSRGAVLFFGVGFVVLVVTERKRLVPAFVACSLATVAFVAVLLSVQSGGEAAKDLLGRGTTGRADIYGWFFQQMGGEDALIGKGMATDITIPADEFGWLVEHPHSVYLTQFYLTGALGAGLLLLLLATAGQAAVKLARNGEALWLCLLAAGAVSLIVDGSYVFSVHSVGRIEPLLLVVPAAIAVGRSGPIWRAGLQPAAEDGDEPS